MYNEIIKANTEFNPRKFLKRLKNYNKERKELERKLAEIPELPSQSNGDRVQTSNMSDLTSQTAIKREKILRQSEVLVKSIEMLNYGLSQLDDDEREVLEQSYFSNKTKDAVVYQLSIKYAKSERSIYYWRSDILDKFGQAIVEHYGQ